MCNLAVAGNGFTSQVVQEQERRWLDSIGKVDSLSGISYLQEDRDKIGKGAVGDSPSLVHLVGRAVVAMCQCPSQGPSCSCTEKETLSMTMTTADSNSKKAVSFGLIHVREYDCVVGDNPTVRVGPPISIGWNYVQKQGVPMDDYEKIKRPRTSDLRMGSYTRKRLLRREFDVSLEDIRAAERIARTIQIQRSQTAQQGKTGAVIEYAMESARRKMHRIFSNKSRLEGILPIPQKVKGLLPDRAYGERLSP
jgi:hypothetical protein